MGTAAACTSGDGGGDANCGANDESCDGDGVGTGITGVTGDGDGDGDGDGLRLDLGDGDGDGDGDGADGGMMGCNQNIDIVFVMDVSTTMTGFFTELEDEIAAVDAYVKTLDTPDAAHYGLVVFVDDFLVTNAGAAITDVNALKSEFTMWRTFTAGNTQINAAGSNSTWPENSLDAIYAGATAFNWRPQGDTLRLIIHTTDDTFWDGPTVGNGINIQRGYDETVMALQSRQIRQYSFADLLGGPSGTEIVSDGWSTPYLGKDPIPVQTFGGWYNINEILTQQTSLADAINAAIDETICEVYPPVG